MRALATPESFDRGKHYYAEGAVVEVVYQDGRLTGRVAGRRQEPYRVSVDLAGGAIGTSSCSCPYEWSGACKHVVALLLALINQPD